MRRLGRRGQHHCQPQRRETEPTTNVCGRSRVEAPGELAYSPGKRLNEERPVADEKYVFIASRWTSGNKIFPVRIEITPQHVSRIKPRLIDSDEESIAIDKVASVNIRTGFIWSDIRIDSSGGSNPITSHGHRKADARQIRDLVEQFQRRK